MIALSSIAVIQCDRLPDIANGQVELTGTTVGSVATYRCNKGFILVGTEIRLCQANGEWSGREPVCRGKPYLASVHGYMGDIVLLYTLQMK